jgi:hypothetical protein
MKRNNEPIMLTDRSAIETDWKCGMMYWWNRCEGGKGIVPLIEADALRIGTEIHNDLELFGKGMSLDEVILSLPDIKSATSQVEAEHLARRLGWVISYGMFIEPRTREEFENVSTEGELVLDRSPLWIAVTPDRVLRRRSNGRLVYREYKSTRMNTAGWVLHWEKAVQLHLGIAAIEEELREEVECGQVLGLYKGYEKDGRLIHPYVWAYRNPDHSDQWSMEWRRGWEHAPVWEYQGGIREWVERGGEEASQKTFIWSAPIFHDPRMIENLVNRREAREREIRGIREEAQRDRELRNLYFEQRFINCSPVIGGACPYAAACFNKTINEEPLKSGLYIPRTPHHLLEMISAGEVEE